MAGNTAFRVAGWLGVWLLLVWTAAARQVELTILHTTDLHGHLLPTTDYDGNEDVGGALRIATAVEQKRAELPNVVLLDGGDLYQGTMAGFLSGGRVMNRVLDFLDYDAWVIGNHEFDWGIPTLQAALEDGSVPVLGANLTVTPGRPNPLSMVKPYVMLERDGVRIGVVGLTTDGLPSWFRPEWMGDVAVLDSVETLARIMPEVRAQEPDVLILLVHQGLRPWGDSHDNEINRIADAFPEFDLMIGGHSHRPVAEARVNRVPYVQAGYHGIWLGQVDMVYDTVERRVVETAGRLQLMDASVPMHEALSALVADTLTEAEQRAAVVHGEAAVDIPARSRVKGQSPMQQLIAQALAEAVDADVVVHGVFEADGLAAGPVSEADLWRVIPYENTIGVMQLTAGQLRQVLEENNGMRRRTQFMGVSGIRYAVDLGAPEGEQVGAVTWPDGSPIHPRKRLGVAFNSYVLASGGTRFPVIRALADDPVNRLEMHAVQTRAALRQYIQRQTPLGPIDGGEAAVEYVR
jgi:5'-nucleotidase / UDP-sugar diphosphatase